MKKRSPIQPRTADIASAETQTTQEEPKNLSPTPISTGRRKFLGHVGGATAATIAAGLTGQTALAQFPGGIKPTCDDPVFPFGVEPSSHAANRFMKSYKCRVDAAK